MRQRALRPEDREGGTAGQGANLGFYFQCVEVT